MIRMVNLVVEVFIDVEEDGAIRAEAIMLRNADKRMLARGMAYREPGIADEPPADENRIAAHALVDLADTLLHRPERPAG